MPKIYFVSDRSRSIVDTIADLGFQDIQENGLMIFHLLRAFNFKQKKSHVWTYIVAVFIFWEYSGLMVKILKKLP